MGPPTRSVSFSSVIFLVLLWLTDALSQLHDHKECHKARNIYGDNNTNFVNCAVQKSEPVTFCQGCVHLYISAETAWQALIDAQLNDTSCLELFVNQDRLNLLLAVRGHSLDLWNSAACSTCFVTAGSILTPDLTAEALEFILKLNATHECIDRSKQNGTVCTQCAGDYGDLNDYYTRNVQRSIADTDGVCFDLRDAMNRTRRAWSDTYKCCGGRHESLLAFWLCSAIVAVLPAVFYGTAVVVRRRSEAAELPLRMADDEGDDGDDREERRRTSGGQRTAADDDDVADVLGRAQVEESNADGDDVSLLGAAEPMASTSVGGRIVGAKLIDVDEPMMPAAAAAIDSDDFDSDGENDDLAKLKKNHRQLSD